MKDIKTRIYTNLLETLTYGVSNGLDYSALSQLWDEAKKFHSDFLFEK